MKHPRDIRDYLASLTDSELVELLAQARAEDPVVKRTVADAKRDALERSSARQRGGRPQTEQDEDLPPGSVREAMNRAMNRASRRNQ